MVNWTYASRTAADNGELDPNTFDLPTPTEARDCVELIEDFDEILGYFELSEEQIDTEMREIQWESVEIWDRTTPIEIANRSCGDEWIAESQVLTFRIEILRSLLSGHTDRGYRNFLIEVCVDYLNALYRKYHEITGHDLEDE